MAQATVRCFAKINLDLRVLDKRRDGYHELRTIFQTVSLHDTLRIEFERARRTEITIDSSVEIADNLAVRAAHQVLDALKINARIGFALLKRIPMGAGLGGGSSNAAAVLLALPPLAGKKLVPERRLAMAESLGSDVPFFLYGGTAVALGRGTELYPLPDQPARPAVIVATGVHVSTKEAYAALRRDVTNPLTSRSESPILREFQAAAWALGGTDLAGFPFQNDFEEAVFGMHPELRVHSAKLARLGARPARMTGSGSALFGIFRTPEEAQATAAKFPAGTAFPVRFVTRRRYRTLWDRALAGASADN